MKPHGLATDSPVCLKHWSIIITIYYHSVPMTLCLRRYPLFRHTRHAVMPTFTFSTLDREPQLPSRSAVSWMMAYIYIWFPNVHDDSRYVHWLKLLPGMYNIIHDLLDLLESKILDDLNDKKTYRNPPCLSIPLSSRRVPPWPQLILHLVFFGWSYDVMDGLLDVDERGWSKPCWIVILIFTNTTMV